MIASRAFTSSITASGRPPQQQPRLALADASGGFGTQATAGPRKLSAGSPSRERGRLTTGTRVQFRTQRPPPVTVT